MGPGGGGGGVPQFTEADAEAIASQIGGVAAVAPEARTGATVVANGRNWTTSVTGSTNDWFTPATGSWPGPRVFRRRAARRRGRLHDRRNRAPRALRQRRGGPAWASSCA
jgi:hypothetical protein